MSKKRIFYVVFFALLVVGFFLVMSAAIPGFTEPKMPPIGSVKQFAFTNQDGKTITNADIEGKVVAVEYFFTTCQGICPRMNNNIRPVYETYKGEKDFLILSHTCDPDTDTPQRLRQYADSLKVDTNKWLFLTGRKDSLYHMARHGYKIDDPKNDVTNIKDDFLHTQFIALVNKKGDIVHIYDALKLPEIAEMKGKIAELLKQ
ncbi:MAG TPA: SCO family protein [Flavisolibacter sp.]|nr:SCO family protein [Flavisolibacter sp.]